MCFVNESLCKVGDDDFSLISLQISNSSSVIYTEFAEGNILSPGTQEGRGKGQAEGCGVCVLVVSPGTPLTCIALLGVTLQFSGLPQHLVTPERAASFYL